VCVCVCLCMCVFVYVCVGVGVGVCVTIVAAIKRHQDTADWALSPWCCAQVQHAYTYTKTPKTCPCQH